MQVHHVSETARVNAPAADVYRVIADYRVGHPRIVPPRYFGPLVVERGGIGAGTEISFSMRVLGRERPVRGVVTEPEPGRVLVETYPESDTVTTFTVDPAGAAAADVTIATALPTRRGLAGVLERAFVTRLLRRIYHEELERLGVVALGGEP